MTITARQLRLVGLALGATLAAACALAVPNAHAVNLLTCPAGSVTNSYTPALTNTPTPLDIHRVVDYGTCLGLAPLTRTGGAASDVGPVVRSCTGLLGANHGYTETIHWNTATTTTFTGETSSQYLAGDVLQSTVIGTVTAGEFLGGHVVIVTAQTGANPLACATTGVSALAGLATLTITP
jgi:hypothetical protein